MTCAKRVFHLDFFLDMAYAINRDSDKFHNACGESSGSLLMQQSRRNGSVGSLSYRCF